MNDKTNPPNYHRTQLATNSKGLHTQGYTVLSTPSRFGFALEYNHVIDLYKPSGAAKVGNTASNFTVQTLSTNFDPESTTFGQPKCTRAGQYVLGRVSGKDLEVEDIEAAVAFIKKHLVEWYREKAAGNTNVEVKKKIARGLNKQAFKDFKAESKGKAAEGGHIYMYEAEEREIREKSAFVEAMLRTCGK